MNIWQLKKTAVLLNEYDTYVKLSTIAAGYEQRHEGQQQSQGGGPVRQVVCGGGGHALGAGVRPCVAHHVVDLLQ